MKKCSYLFIVPIMILFGAMALGSGSSSSSDSSDKSITNVETSEAAEVETADTEKEIEETTEEPAATQESSGITIDEMVLVDQDNIKITATGIEDGMFGTELNLLVENNSDKNLTFQARNASVNGYMVDTMMSEDVASGKKSNTELTFTTSGLKDCGIDTIAEMEFAFHIFTTEEWDEYLDTEPVSVSTSAAATYTQTYDDSGEVFYDQNGIKIVGKGLSSDDSFFGPGLIVYIENNSSQDFTVQVRDTSVNGFMVDTSMSEDVIAGKKAMTAVTFMNSSLEENGITDITSVETSFHVFDMDSWDTIVDTNPITISFN